MASPKPKSLLTRQQKLFRMDSVYPLDANNVDMEEAMSRLFVYLRTGGRQITRTDKVIFNGDGDDAETPKAVLDAVLEGNGVHFSGVTDDERRALLTAWLESHFALMARRGRTDDIVVPENLDSLFAFRRHCISQMGSFPYVLEPVPAVLAWYPSAAAVLVWNLSAAPATVHIAFEGRQYALNLPALDVALLGNLAGNSV